jgi:mannose-6-phosphate isomerase-like protein (cupin superfamily)
MGDSPMVHVEKIVWMEKLLALIIRYDFSEVGIHFFTPNDFSQQLAYMNRPKGYEIDPHVHNAIPRNIEWTQEVLFIKSGRVRVDFYDQERVYLESRILNAGDVILLAHGGHGFTMLEASEIIEVKQGPYTSDKDKTRFKGVSEEELKMKR